MSFGLLGDVNWLAVAVATIAYFVIGAVWFHPRAFGSLWMRSIGWQPGPDERPGAAFFVAPFVGSLVAVVALGLIAEAAGVDGLGDGIVLGLVAGVGLVGAVLFVTAIFEPTKPSPWTWFGVTAGYHLAGLLLAAVILALW